MLIDHLYYLLVLEETGSINKASVQLHTSPQNLSRILTQIENELALDLFIRKKNGVSFTEAGVALLEFSKQTLLNFNSFLEKTRTKQQLSEITGKILIYSSNLLSELFLNDLIIKFHEFYPNISITNIEVDMLDGYELINTTPGVFGMFCSLSDEKSYPNIRRTLLGKGTIVAIVNKHSDIAEQKELSIHTLLQENILCYAHHAIENTELPFVLGPFCDKAPKLTVTTNLNAYYKWVALDNYICFATLEGFKNSSNQYKNELKAIPIKDLPTSDLPFAFLTNVQSTYTIAQEVFLNFVQTFFHLDTALY